MVTIVPHRRRYSLVCNWAAIPLLVVAFSLLLVAAITSRWAVRDREHLGLFQVCRDQDPTNGVEWGLQILRFTGLSAPSGNEGSGCQAISVGKGGWSGCANSLGNGIRFVRGMCIVALCLIPLACCIQCVTLRFVVSARFPAVLTMFFTVFCALLPALIVFPSVGKATYCSSHPGTSGAGASLLGSGGASLGLSYWLLLGSALLLLFAAICVLLAPFVVPTEGDLTEENHPATVNGLGRLSAPDALPVDTDAYQGTNGDKEALFTPAPPYNISPPPPAPPIGSSYLTGETTASTLPSENTLDMFTTPGMG